VRAEFQVFDAQVREFLDARARVVQRQQEGAITERQTAERWQLIEERRDLVSVEKARLRWRDALTRNPGDLLRDGEVLGHPPPEKLEKRVQDHQPVVACPPVIVAAVFQMLEKAEDALERQGVERDLCQPTRHIGGHEGQKEPQPIAIGLDGGRPEALLEWQLVGEEGVEQGAE
jgi:hypothetical protein